MEIIAYIKTDFSSKFAVPRQSGLAECKGKIVFEKPYAVEDAVRGLENFSHIWALWGFSLCSSKKFTPTVRPPRLGGNKRVGVFATRSPFRPNNIGLSSLKLEKIVCENGKVELYVSGVDMVNNTPIYDIKPYLPYTDCHTDATGGFAQEKINYRLDVDENDENLKDLNDDIKKEVIHILQNDPRPAYQNDENRIYAFEYADYKIKFSVKDTKVNIIKIKR